MDFNYIVGNKIAALRRERGLTGERLAELLGISPQAVSKWENGKCLPETALLPALSKALGTSLDSLLGVKVEPEYGIFRRDGLEIVRTEQIQYELFGSTGDGHFGVRLFYKGERVALVIYNVKENRVRWELRHMSGALSMNSNHEHNEMFWEMTPTSTDGMKLVEKIKIAPKNIILPTYGNAGVKECLQAWRRTGKFVSTSESTDAGGKIKISSQLSFTLCTDNYEYCCIIDTNNDYLYCGASCHAATDNGMAGLAQYLRIRDNKIFSEDNRSSDPVFACHSRVDKNLGALIDSLKFDPSAFDPSGYRQANGVHYWSVKRAEPGEIVLFGCGGDEYRYRRDDEDVGERFE